jgi:hypothetical protein
MINKGLIPQSPSKRDSSFGLKREPGLVFNTDINVEETDQNSNYEDFSRRISETSDKLLERKQTQMEARSKFQEIKIVEKEQFIARRAT